jgi:hypothetical protein
MRTIVLCERLKYGSASVSVPLRQDKNQANKNEQNDIKSLSSCWSSLNKMTVPQLSR